MSHAQKLGACTVAVPQASDADARRVATKLPHVSHIWHAVRMRIVVWNMSHWQKTPELRARAWQALVADGRLTSAAVVDDSATRELSDHLPLLIDLAL